MCLPLNVQRRPCWLQPKVVRSRSGQQPARWEHRKINPVALKQLEQAGLNNKLKTTQSVFNISYFIQVVGVLL